MVELEALVVVHMVVGEQVLGGGSREPAGYKYDTLVVEHMVLEVVHMVLAS